MPSALAERPAELDKPVRTAPRDETYCPRCLLLAGRRHEHGPLLSLTIEEAAALADILRRVTKPWWLP